jgi:hypothetical protein
MPTRNPQESGQTFLAYAFDINHQRITVGAIDDTGPATIVGDAVTLLKFLHKTRTGALPHGDGHPRRVAYWVVANADSHGVPDLIWITPYGRSCVQAIARIPDRILAGRQRPVMLPAVASYQQCRPGCTCNRHVKAQRSVRRAA